MNANIHGSVNNTEKMEPLYKFLLILYLTLTSISLILLSSSDVRPLSYYLIASGIAAIILLQILLFETTSKRALLILAQVMFLGLNLIWGGTLKYYYYIGRTDLLGHIWIAQNLLASGHITEAFDIYRAFPLWHILNVDLYILSGLSMRMNDLLNITSGLVYFVLPAAAFVLALKLLNDRKIASLASLIVATSPIVMIYGTYSISRSIVSFILVVLLFVLAEKGHRNASFLVALFFILSIITYHTVSIAFVLVILALIFILQALFVPDKSRHIVSGKFLIMSIVLTFGYWALFARDILTVIATNIMVSAPEGILTKSVYTTPLNELFNYLQYMPYLLFILVGAILVLRSKKCNDTLKLFGMIAMLMIPVSFPGPMLLLNKLASNLSMDRFEEYAFIFLALAAAIGFIILYKRGNRLMRTALVVVFVGWVLLSVSNDFVSSDNPLVKRPFYTSYLEESEVTSINHLVAIDAGYLMSDYVTERYLEFSPYMYISTPLLIDDKNSTFKKNDKNDMLVIRSDELQRRPLKVVETDSSAFNLDVELSQVSYVDKSDPVYTNVARFNKVYDSKSVNAYE
jgi:hypothetical protein